MVDLFTSTDYSSNDFQTTNLQDGELRLYPNFYSEERANLLLVDLQREIQWKQEKMHMYGKTHDLPRLMAFYGDQEQGDNSEGEKNRQYSFSGIRKAPTKWTKSLIEIKKKIEMVSQKGFNSVLANLYRDGSDGVAWHSDDEVELGKAPVIGSVSLGQVREFQLKHKTRSELRHSLFLPHGSFLLMSGLTQKYWLHQVPKRTSAMSPRINLTFRTIY